MKGIIFAIIALAFISVNAEEYNNRCDNVTSEVFKNKWELLLSANDSESIKIEIKEKYGTDKTYYGKAIFFNGKQYKIVAPWFDNILINLDNITDIKTMKISIKDI
jgi:hypothetical protein